MAVTIYGTRTDADTYHSDRGNSAWGAALEADRDAALARATDYIDGRYWRRLPTGAYTSAFPGKPTAAAISNGRQWPRSGAKDGYGNALPDTAVPDAVQRATFEAALRELAAPGSLSPDFVPADRVTEERIGALGVKYVDPYRGRRDGEVAEAMRTPNRPIVPMIDEILAPILQGGSVSLGVAVDVV